METLSPAAARTAPPAAQPPPQIPLPPSFPPGVDPATYRLREVERLLKQAAYLPLFSVPNPALPNRPIPLSLPFLPSLPFLITAVEVNEQTHRFDVGAREADGELSGIDRVGQPAATVGIRWTVIPDDFQAGPGRLPPPTILNPFRSQRFEMLDGQFRFQDRAGSGFHGFGTGRTFPQPGSSYLAIGAVIDVLEGFGQFRGMAGTVVVNGVIRPPDELAINVMVRLMDPGGGMLTREPLSPLRPVPDPDPGSTFMTFLGEPDPDRPVTLNLGPGGKILGSNVHELLRPVRLDFDDASGAVRSRAVEGPIVGRVDATLYFDPLAPQPVSPIQTRDGVFTFFDREGRVAGTVRANMVEGRAFRTPLAGAPMPVFRFGGFGPLLGGSGRFAGAGGMMTMNSAVSVFPRTLSNLYVLRFVDPVGRYRAAVGNADA
ncbi:MAG TPA: hypothetical protein VIH93_13765 [Thermoanaerobaculia bacterium]